MAYRAVVVRQVSRKEVERSMLRFGSVSELPFQSSSADVTVKVSFSCLNYKPVCRSTSTSQRAPLTLSDQTRRDGIVLTGRPGVAKQRVCRGVACAGMSNREVGVEESILSVLFQVSSDDAMALREVSRP